MAPSSLRPILESMPKDKSTWDAMIRANNLNLANIHTEQELKSGSKAGARQFLLMRVLWLPESASALHDWPSKAHLELAREILKGPHGKDAEWDTYLDSIKKNWTRRRGGENGKDGLSSLGRFALVRHYQLAVGETEIRAKEAGSDTSADARPASSGLSVSASPAAGPSRPSTPDTTPNFGIFNTPGSAATVGTNWSPSGFPSAAAMTQETANDLGPNKDEQIINTALLVFLDALTINLNREVKGEWSSHRRPFTFNCQQSKKSFNSLVDGYLYRYGTSSTIQDSDICAIVEAKAGIRNGSKHINIRIQESLEMACWICSCPPAALYMEACHTAGVKMERVLIAQDRHEIYIVRARFNRDYVDFLLGRTVNNLGDAFLEMHEYGPFDTLRRDDMKHLSAVLLAFALKKCEPSN